jgi:sodium/hydrogen antiporter
LTDITFFAFALVLLVAVLISGRAERTFLSTAVIFLIGGFLVGPGVLKLSSPHLQEGLQATLVQLALVASLFSDGMKLGLTEVRENWGLSGRALLLGMPFTFLLIAVATHLLFKLPWLEAFLVGAVLSPTDPVFASLIIERDVIPLRLRRLLNVESGLNDGLALPVILILVRVIGSDKIEPLSLAGELLGGVLIGVAIPWLAIRLESNRFFATSAIYEVLMAFAIGILILALCTLLNTNVFLAMYSAGITIATLSDRFRQAFEQFGELVTELLKAAALFLFGMLITPNLFRENGVNGYVFAAFVLFIARPLSIFIVLLHQKLTRLETVTAAWFGPKGFSSIFYALLLLKSAILNANQLFDILALTIIVSIVLHSSTDVFFARRFSTHTDRAEDGLLSE